MYEPRFAAVHRRRRYGSSGPSRLILKHTFTGADSALTVGNADTGQAPTVIQHSGAASGIFGRQTNMAYLANPNGGTDYCFCHFDGGAAGDFRVEWDMPAYLFADSLQSTGGVFSMVDATHVLIWDVNTSGGNNAANMTFYKDIGGGFVSIGGPTANIDITVAGTLAVVGLVAAGTLSVYWNGTLILSIAGVGALLSGTRFGLSHSAALRAIRYDALRVYR
jgi:hypothetical protein